MVDKPTPDNPSAKWTNFTKQTTSVDIGSPHYVFGTLACGPSA